MDQQSGYPTPHGFDSHKQGLLTLEAISRDGR